MYGESDAADKLCESYETDGSELSAKIVDRWLTECVGHFQKLTAEQRAYKVIHTYHQLEDPDEEMYRKLIGWFLDGRDRAAKDRAMERMFVEVLDRGRKWETRMIKIQA